MGLECPAVELLSGDQKYVCIFLFKNYYSIRNFLFNHQMTRDSLFPFVNYSKEGLRTTDEIEQGIGHIIADIISKDPNVLDFVRQL